MILDLLYWLVGLPCMACLQSMFAVLLPAKTWQIRRLQAYVFLITGTGLSFITLAVIFYYLAGSKAVIAAPAVVGYVLLLIGGWLGKCVEDESTAAGKHDEGAFRPSKPDGL